MVPPVRRYYETLRLPVARLAELRCLRPTIPPLRPIFVPTDRGREVGDQPGAWYAGSPSGCEGGGDGASQVPGEPFWSFALLSDPGPTGLSLWDQRLDSPTRPPRLTKTRARREKYDFGAQWHGVRPRCLRFAVTITRPHARLASGGWPSSTGRDWLPAGFQRKVSSQGYPPLPSFLGAMSIHFTLASVRRSLMSTQSTFASVNQIDRIGSRLSNGLNSLADHF